VPRRGRDARHRAPGEDRSFIVELHGRIRILDHDRLIAEPFLDITKENGGPVNGTGVSELGLLGLAFHPAYATNHQLFVFYTTDSPMSQTASSRTSTCSPATPRPTPTTSIRRAARCCSRSVREP
jgi:hypothetical protein